MSERTPDGAVPRETLSALADGCAHADEVDRACAAWRNQPEARATWHAYHLIGEAMRSPDHEGGTSDSSAFLQRMRTRLAQEPVVFSPQSAQATMRGAAEATDRATRSPDVMRPLKRRVWAGPMAVAASFALIVGVLTANLGGAGGQSGGAQMARSGVGWSEGVADSSGMASALGAGGSFSAARVQGHAWLPSDPGLEQAMTVQRPQPAAPQTFSDVPGLVNRVSVEPRR